MGVPWIVSNGQSLLEVLPRIISLVFVQLICMLFSSAQVEHWFKRDCIFETEELEAIISDNIVSSIYLSMLHNRLKSSMWIMNEIGPRGDPWGMPAFKKSHCEHGKPGKRTRWRLWDKNGLNHSHNNLGTDFGYNFFQENVSPEPIVMMLSRGTMY